MSDPVIPAPIDIDRIAAELQDCAVGHPLHYRQSVSSTMDLAAELAVAGAPSGTAVIAEEQTAGRGRRGRTWQAPPATALLVSLVLRPPQLQLPPTHLPMLAGIALVEAIAALAPELEAGLSLKWPNDVVIAQRAGPEDSRRDHVTGGKLAGILVETRLHPAGTVDYAVAGMGINANQRQDDLPQVPAAPTSLALHLGRCVDRSRLFVLVCRRLAAWLVAPSAEQVRLAWRRRLSTLGRTVTLYPHGIESEPLLTGFARDIDGAGSLIVEDQEGRRHTFGAGDVTVRASA